MTDQCECMKYTRCCYCGDMLNDKEMEPRVDPFAHEIYDDITLHKICESCEQDSADEI